ncbi:MAG: efflux RND transporter periplasmic adaptor subunit [Phycisphaerae bacterium]|nr:efflux RND transporter periplasmic adaptor subunit [Phycisphaerae bacterium]
MRTLIGTIVLAAAIGGLYLLNGAVRRDDGTSLLHVAPELPVTVEVAEPTRRNIIRIVQAPGDVEPLDEVDISAEVVAKIIEMPVEEGDTVHRGDLLCRLDDADYLARLRSAEANVAKLQAMIVQAQADFEKADRDLKRQVSLSEADATSARELADYHTVFVQAKAALEIRRQELIDAQARLESAQEDLRRTVITAPIDGVVSQLFAKNGEVVVTGTMNNPGTRIMVISDLSRMQVRCRVDEGDAPLVQPDQRARIYLQSDTEESVPGTVARVATKGTKPAGRDVVTFETLVLVDGEDKARVRPGMTANVEIEVARSDDALVIPVQAVVHRKRRDLPESILSEYEEMLRSRTAVDQPRLAEYIPVIFLTEGDRVHPSLVETGISDSSAVEILHGITPGDRLVTGPFRSLDQLKDGSKIEIPGNSEPTVSKKDSTKDEPAPKSGETLAKSES